MVAVLGLMTFEHENVFKHVTYKFLNTIAYLRKLLWASKSYQRMQMIDILLKFILWIFKRFGCPKWFWQKKRCRKKAGQVEPFLSWICSNLYTPLCEDSKIFVCNTITMLALSTIEEGFDAIHLYTYKIELFFICTLWNGLKIVYFVKQTWNFLLQRHYWTNFPQPIIKWSRRTIDSPQLWKGVLRYLIHHVVK